MATLFQPLDFIMYPDSRGSLREVFNENAIEMLGIKGFPHALYVESHADVLRGMHFQLPAQGKFIMLLEGSVHFFGLDLRRGSTYAKMQALAMHQTNARALWLPPGCAFGYRTYTPTKLLYFLSEPRSTQEYAIDFFDKTWNTFLADYDWKRDQFIMSEKDAKAPNLGTWEPHITPMVVPIV